MKSVISDVIIVGGGNIGSAIAYGIAEMGLCVSVLDEGDTALRAARGNFGQVWFQGKGLGLQRYVDWCLETTQKWPAFAAALEDKTGVSLAYEKPGGLDLCRSEKDYARRRRLLEQLRQQSGSGEYDCEMIDRREVEQLIPELKLGPNIVGASFSRQDGHVNPLFLIRAMRTAFIQSGGAYFPGAAVCDIRHEDQAFAVKTPAGCFQAPKLVLAAGVGIPHLAAMLGMQMPVRPQRGQILVTERLQPVLSLTINGIRQTSEGSFMFGYSNEEVGFDTSVTVDVISDIARRTIEAFPDLAGVRIVRTWGALRPLTPDKYPLYCESDDYPGAFVVSSHSGVSLAPMYASHVARWIVDGTQPEGFDHFHPRRFDV
jgi:glycine/D-amino acid oxidase-like deaminating enzyme